MKLSEKIIYLRKQQGWSQEELASRMEVSRQSVSKWESAGSYPEIDKIIQMSSLFNVSTDYLLKDNSMEKSVETEGVRNNVVRFSKGKALAYLDDMKVKGKKIAFGVSLCILAPIFIIGGTLGEEIEALKSYDENVLMAIGGLIMFLLIAFAVFIFISTGDEDDARKNEVDLDNSTRNEVVRLKDEYLPRYRTTIAFAVSIIILAVIPIIGTALLEMEAFTILAVMLLLAIVSVSVNFIVRASFVKDSYLYLLNEGEFSQERRTKNEKVAKYETAYWSVTVAIYLLWSFLTNDWQITWLVFPVAGVMSSIIPLMIKESSK